MRTARFVQNNLAPLERLAPRIARLGFTLIELLVAMTIVGIIAAISGGIYYRQAAYARKAATEGLITMLDQALKDRVAQFAAQSFEPLDRHRYLGYGTQPLAGAPPGTLRDPPPAPLARIPKPYVPHDAIGRSESIGVKEKRSRLIARLDAMRGEFPQQFIDFMRAHNSTGSQGDQDETMTYVGLADHQYVSPAREAIFLDYLRRTNQLTGKPAQFIPMKSYTPVPKNHLPQTESSECLYLLLTTHEIGGSTFPINKIDPRFIADTDNDGLPEFVDAWGTPLRFYRWPTDYLRYLIDVRKQLPETLVRNPAVSDDPEIARSYRYKFWRSNMDPNWLLTRTWLDQNGSVSWFTCCRDDFEGYSYRRPDYGAYFRLHDLYVQQHFRKTPHVNVAEYPPDSNPQEPWTYPLLPLIVSAGADALDFGPSERWKAFGLAVRFDHITGSELTPYAGDLDVRCARVGGCPEPSGRQFVPQSEMIRAVGDNIVSILLRSGAGG